MIIMELQSFRRPVKRFPSLVMGTVWIVLMLLALPVQGQRKQGHWVDPVDYFKLKGKGYLKEEALSDYMWKTKERYIVGMKCTVYNFTTVGDEYGESGLPVQASPSTFYLYINEPGVIAATSDWTKLTNGNLLGIYRVGATDVTFSFNERTHRYSFFYYPEGTYDFAGTKDLKPEHRQALDIREMGMFYFDKKGLIGYFENAFMQNDDWDEGANGELIDIAHRHEFYLQFSIDEVLLDGTDTPLTESERQSLINTMDDLTDWLMGRGDPLGLGEHTDAGEAAVVEVVSIIGSILLGNGIAAATGGAAGGALGGLGGAGGGGSPTAPPEMPKMEGTNPKKKEEEEEEAGPETPPEPSTPYFDSCITQHPDGTLTATDPATGKILTYYPTSDGKWESEMGTVYDKQELDENLRFRNENAGVLKLDAETAAKNVAEQHAQWEKESKELSQYAKEYKEWKEQEEAEWQKQKMINKLADKYDVPPTEKAVKDAIKFEQTMAQLDANIANSEAEAIGESIDFLESVDKKAELVVNVMGEAVPGGRVVKNVYTFAKATGVAASEAYNQDMSLGDAAKHIGIGATNGAIGVLQNQAGELSSNVLSEAVMVIGGESVKEGLNALAKGENPCDAMTSAAAKKAGYFLTGKVVQAEAKSIFGTPSASGPADNMMEKYLGKGDMHANWSNLASTNSVNIVEGLASGVQEVGATYDGFKALDPVADPNYNPSLPGKFKTVDEFTKAVKDFSNAAENYRKTPN